MDYSKLINSLTAEMKKGIQYKRIPQPFKALLIVAMIPLIVSFVLSKFIYSVTLFFYKMISAPAEHLHRWLKDQKDEVHHATQAVMYFVCLPYIFLLQVLLSLNAFAFYFQWFFLMLQGYLLSLGGIKWQPIITEASFEDEACEGELKPDLNIVNVFACVAFATFALCVLIPIITRYINPFEHYKLYIFFAKTGRIVKLVHAALICIVNPILFKKK